MDGFVRMIGDLLGGIIVAAVPASPQQRPVELLLVLVFAATVLAVFGIGALTQPAKPRRRAVEVAEEAEAPTLRRGNKALQRLVAPVERALVGNDEARRSATRQQLMRAGFFAPSATGVYHAIRAGLAVTCGVAAALTVPLLPPDAETAVLALVVLSGVAFGFYAPAVWLSARVRDRQRQIREAFPDALDLLLVCVEAGLGLDAAIARVGDELAPIHPVLAQQFLIMGLELRAGRSREDALRGLGERSGLDEVNAFVNLLVQSDRLGTSIGDALRVGADEMRTRRMLRAEEKAHQLPVKLSVPLVLFLLPGLVTVIMLPPAIQMLRMLGPAMSGQ